MADAETTPGGMGCFAKGCLITSVAGFALFILVFGGGWFLYQKAVYAYTAPQAVQITSQGPTDAQYKSAAEMLERLQTAARNNTRETIEFTATDLNALMARHPSFANPRRQIFISMANSIMTVEMSVPFDHSRLPLLKGRWFNGAARFRLDYVYGQFTVIPESLVANGHRVSREIFSENFVSSFNQSFTRSFKNSLRQNRESEALWERIKSMTVRDDKLAVMIEPAREIAFRPNESWLFRRNASPGLPNVRPCILLGRKV